jgi:hypothetical protein
LEIGFEERRIDRREELVNLIYEAFMPHSVEGLADVQKYCIAVLFSLHGLVDTMNNAVNLLYGGVASAKTKLVVWNPCVWS